MKRLQMLDRHQQTVFHRHTIFHREKIKLQVRNIKHPVFPRLLLKSPKISPQLANSLIPFDLHFSHRVLVQQLHRDHMDVLRILMQLPHFRLR